MNKGRARRVEVNEAIEKIRREIVNANGEWSNRDLQSRLAKQFQENPGRWLDAEYQARKAVEAWDEELRPKPVDPVGGLTEGSVGQQGSLFMPDLNIPQGGSQRVRMGDLRRHQMIKWDRIEDEAFSMTERTYQARQAYRSDRLRVWSDQDATLTDLERRAFGWSY